MEITTSMPGKYASYDPGFQSPVGWAPPPPGSRRAYPVTLYLK